MITRETPDEIPHKLITERSFDRIQEQVPEHVLVLLGVMLTALTQTSVVAAGGNLKTLSDESLTSLADGHYSSMVRQAVTLHNKGVAREALGTQTTGMRWDT
jgi:hypothetical protein